MSKGWMCTSDMPIRFTLKVKSRSKRPQHAEPFDNHSQPHKNPKIRIDQHKYRKSPLNLSTFNGDFEV